MTANETTAYDKAVAHALSEALRLVEHGYQLTPVTLTRDPIEGDKRFRFHRNWKREAATAWSRDPEVIRDWSVEHRCSFASRGGDEAGVDFVDLDVKDGKNGLLWWSEQSYPLGSMPCDTPSGGMHLPVKACGLPTRANVLAPGVDMRGNGGLVYAPGSFIVGVDGEPEPETYRVQGELVKVADLEALPDDLIAEIKAYVGPRKDHPRDGRIEDADREIKFQICKAKVDELAAWPRPDVGDKGALRDFRHAQMGAAMLMARLADADEDYGWTGDDACNMDGARDIVEEASLKVWPEGLNRKDHENIEAGLRDGPHTARWRWRGEGAGGRVFRSGGNQGEGEAGRKSFVLPAQVWEASPELGHIWNAAQARQVSPDVVLHGVLAIIASLMHHGSRVDTGKGQSVLSYYSIAIGASGSGKSEGLDVARDLLSTWTRDRFAVVGADGYIDLPLGSGEGMIEQFMGKKKVKLLDENGDQVLNAKTGEPVFEEIRTQVRHNALFHTDEGRALLAIDSRKGATVMSVLCEMWSGSVAGQSNAEVVRTRKIAAKSYVVGLLLGFQPATIGDLFSDTAGGAPQRFAFADTKHADITDDEVEWPGELAPEVPVTPEIIVLPSHLRRQVRVHQGKRARGEDDSRPLDGHRMLITCRTAALLALLHGSVEVTDWHWELATTIVETSCQLRDDLAASVQREAVERGRQREESAVRSKVRAADEVAKADRIRRAADRVVQAVADAEGGQLTYGRAKNAVRRWRDVADEAITLALADGRLEGVDRGGIRSGGPREVAVLRIPTDGEV